MLTRFVFLRGLLTGAAVSALIAGPISCSSNADDTNHPNGIPGEAGIDAAMDAGTPPDAEHEDSQPPTDATDSSDSTVDSASPDVSSDAPAATCEGTCRQLDVKAKFDSTSLIFDHAFYGLTPPEVAGDPWTIHLEVHAGGSSKCPTESSPTPNATLVIGKLGLDETSPPPSVSFVDFTGDLLPNSPVENANSVDITGLIPKVCVSCAQNQQDDPDGFVALDIDAVFASGTVKGHVFATHCNSLDL